MGLKSLETFYQNLIGWVTKLSVQMFQPLIIIYRRGIFVLIMRIYMNLFAIVLTLYIPDNDGKICMILVQIYYYKQLSADIKMYNYLNWF